MTSNPLRKPPDERLRYLAETVLAEADLLRGTDARTLAAMASQVVVVVEALRTPRATVRAAFDELQGCPAVVSLLDHAASGVPA
jgi:hypothetical protein